MSTTNTIIKKVARETHISEAIVRLIFNRCIDYMVEEVVINGKLKISSVLSISSYSVQGYETDKGLVLPHKRLTVRISSRIKLLFNKYQSGSVSGNVRDYWRG
jgi:hypothetical protein